VQVYERMQEQELEATATTYTALVSAYCKSDDLDAALEVCLMLLFWQDAMLHTASGQKISSSSTLQDFNALYDLLVSCLWLCHVPIHHFALPFSSESHSVMHCSNSVHTLM